VTKGSGALKTFDPRSSAQWHEWLAKNHASESAVWLVFYKPHTKRTSIAYLDALDEALCFGWIDSLIKRLDDDRYARKFTPRKPGSRWSDVNRKRFAVLKASGRMTPMGLERPPTDRGYDPPPPTPSKVPRYIRQALGSHPEALRFFDSLAASDRRLYIMWIDSAKRPETKARRLAEAIRTLAAGKKLGLK
jgi:uncharacterized protein YdeI (YjbR/CyaY-like superfamily)